ncbi:WD40 repeat domain-containing protein [Rhizobium leguminosarum]|uniref:WD40 repeat domain-containing protein n=1 Tax=Rhizobium leguminosarum TaxID=384 RepID=UPI001FDF5561|nr:hypothetical protein [Rhizobium leguminosarum]
MRVSRVRRIGVSTVIVALATALFIAVWQASIAIGKQREAEITLSRSDALRGLELVDQDDAARGMAYLGRSQLLDAENTSASLRLTSLLNQRSFAEKKGSFRRVSGAIRHIAFSPDGSLVAVASLTECTIFRVADGAEIIPSFTHHLSNTHLEFSHNGQQLLLTYGYGALGGTHGTIVVWDLAKQSPVRREHNVEGMVWTGSFSHDDAEIVVATAFALLAFPVDDLSKPKKSLQFSSVTDQDGSSVADNAFADVREADQSNKWVFIYGSLGPGMIGFWNRETGATENVTPLPAVPAALDVNQKTSSILLRFPNNYLEAFDFGDSPQASTSYLLDSKDFSVRSGPMRDAALLADARILPNGMAVFAGSRSGGLDFWNGTDGAAVNFSGKHKEAVTAIDVASHSLLAASGSTDGTARIWNTMSSNAFSEEVVHTSSVTAVKFDPSATHLVTGTEMGDVTLWKLSSRGSLPLILNAKSKIAGSVVGLDGTRFLASGEDGSLTVWDAVNGTVLSRNQLEGAVEIEVTEGSAIAILVSDGRLRLLKMEDGQFLSDWIELGSSITQVSFDSTGKRFIAATEDGTVSIRSLDDAQEIRKLKHTGPVFSAIFLPDGSVLTAARTEISIWNVTTGTQTKTATSKVRDQSSTLTLSGEQGEKILLDIVDLRLSPDGKHLLAICGNEGVVLDSPTIRKRFFPVKAVIWDLHDLRYVAELDGGHDSLTSIGVSESGRFIAIGSHDGNVQVYTMDGKPRGAALRNSFPVQSISFSEDEKTIAVGGKADYISVWRDWELTAVPFNIRVGGAVRAFARFQGLSSAVFALSGEKTARIWDEVSGRPLTDPLLVSSDIASAIVDAKRNLIALVDSNGHVFVHRFPLPSSNAARCELNKLGEAMGGYVLNSNDLPVAGSASSSYQRDSCRGESGVGALSNWFGSPKVAKSAEPTAGSGGDDYVKKLLADSDNDDLSLLTVLIGWNPSDSCLRHWTGFLLSKVADRAAAPLASSLLADNEPRLKNDGCPPYE